MVRGPAACRHDRPERAVGLRRPGRLRAAVPHGGRDGRGRRPAGADDPGGAGARPAGAVRRGPRRPRPPGRRRPRGRDPGLARARPAAALGRRAGRGPAALRGRRRDRARRRAGGAARRRPAHGRAGRRRPRTSSGSPRRRWRWPGRRPTRRPATGTPRCSTTSAWCTPTPRTGRPRWPPSRRRSPARERIGDAGTIRVARWMVGWSLRNLGRTDEALAVQRALKAELEAAGEEDPYVDEELALLEG